MTILERHWWLRVVAALLALASVPAFLVWYLAFALRFDRWHGPIVVVQGALLATIVVTFLLGVALDATLKAVLAYRRAAQRNTSLEGYQDATPLADVGAAWAEIQAEDLRLVEASWPGAVRSLIGDVLAVLFLAGAAIYLGGEVLQAILVVAGIHAHLIPSSTPPTRGGTRPLMVSAVVLAAFLLAVLVPALLMLSSFLDPGRYLPARIRVDGDGITRWSALGARRTVRWHEVKLVEVASVRAPQGRYGRPRRVLHYALSGAGTCIRWADAPGPPFRQPEATGRVAPAVVAYAHLRPRTLDRDLLPAAEPTTPVPALERAAAGFFGWLGRGAFVAALLAIALTEPIWAASMSPIGLIWLYSWLRGHTGIRLPTRLPPSPLEVGPDPVPEMAPGVVFEVPTRTPTGVAANRALLMVMVLIYMVVVGGVGAMVIVDGTRSGSGLPLISGWGILAAIALYVASLGLGIACMVYVVRARGPVLLADPVGVRQRNMMGAESRIPWDRVEEVAFQQLGGIRTAGVGTYRVVGKNGMVAFTWPARSGQGSRPPTTPGTTPVTPNQMAALIAKHTGMPLASEPS